MKKPIILMLVFSLCLGLFLVGCTNGQNGDQQGQPNGEIQENDQNAEAAVKNVVENFGKKLQKVSLLAPENDLKQSMEENYGEYVSPALLAQWAEDPQNAPGRLTSSPWPDRIEILGMEKVSATSYLVEGEIIEVTSAEKESGEAAARRIIALTIEKIEDKWLINSVELGQYKDKASNDVSNGTGTGNDTANSNTKTGNTGNSAVVYKNTQYQFSFPLPESWKKYSIVTEEWVGLGLDSANEGEVVESGPLISIRHPEWTAQKPRQDIPILVFTLEQWKALQQEKFHIGAAPILPKELGRNSKYVFALPARYNFAFPTGYEEVEEILESNPLQAL